MSYNIASEDLPAVEALLHESVPGRVYILYGWMDDDYACIDLYFSLDSALLACAGSRSTIPSRRRSRPRRRTSGSG